MLGIDHGGEIAGKLDPPGIGEGDPFHPAALEACAACTVRAECLEYALTAPWARWGLWGGTGPRERRAILRRRRREAA